MVVAHAFRGPITATSALSTSERGAEGERSEVSVRTSNDGLRRWSVASPPRSSAWELSFRPLERSDFAVVSRWLGAPHVARWWMEPADAASVEAHYGPCVDGDDPTEIFVITSGQHCIGMIQRYRLSDDAAWDRAIGMPGAAGIDYLIGEPEWLGIGVGALAIEAFTDAVSVAYPDVTAVVAVLTRNVNPATPVKNPSTR